MLNAFQIPRDSHDSWDSVVYRADKYIETINRMERGEMSEEIDLVEMKTVNEQQPHELVDKIVHARTSDDILPAVMWEEESQNGSKRSNFLRHEKLSLSLWILLVIGALMFPAFVLYLWSH